MNGRLLTVSMLLVLSFRIGGCVEPPAESLAVTIYSEATAPLKAGAAARDITPQQIVTIAGGVPYQLTLGVHDPIWARAVVFDNGVNRIALVSVDLIGIDYDDVSRARERVAALTDVGYVMIAATHTHHGPDVIGAWSPTPFDRDTEYKVFVAEQIARAVEAAVANLEPAVLSAVQGSAGEPPLSRDTRAPDNVPNELTVWQVHATASGETIATGVHYAAHPILVGSALPEISSDFPHYLRAALESGWDGELGSIGGYGGVALYFNGLLGGRISPAQTEPLANSQEPNPFYRSAEAYGYRLAERVDRLLESDEMLGSEEIALAAVSEPIQVPIENPLLRTATELLLIRRPIEDGVTTSEVAIVRVGPLEFFAVPGMPFPESWDGSASPIAGSDFPEAEPTPGLQTLATGSIPVVIGLGNDLLGYIIPRPLWDAAPPFSTGQLPPYGELISAGPGTAEQIYTAFEQLSERLSTVMSTIP